MNRRSAPEENSWFRLEVGQPLFRKRMQFVIGVCVFLSVALIARLSWLQMIAAPEYAALAQMQRKSTIVVPAHRGTIYDHQDRYLAYTMEARLLSVHPRQLPKYMEERHKLWPKKVSAPDQRMDEIAQGVADMFSGVADIKAEDILSKLKADSDYEVLIRNVDPDLAQRIVEEYPEITSERQDIRQYPNGSIGENIIGKISADNEGQFGLELSQDSKLQGINGSRTVDIGANGAVIPGSVRDQHPAVDGSSYKLSIDLDAQTYIQQQVQRAKEQSQAESASAVVMEAKTGRVLAMAQSDTIDPNADIDSQLAKGKEFGNSTVSEVFEPGSVAKIITAAAAIEDKKTTPDEVLAVPGSISMSGVTVNDAWVHGLQNYTTTGIFAKSSNVGTLMLAQRVGEAAFSEYLHKFGLGQITGIGLPHETAGSVPDLAQWSGGTFANLPIGQGMNMSLLQMTGIYQTIANGGVRIEPRIIDEVKNSNGDIVEQIPPKETQVISPETAQTVKEMFRAVLQRDPTGVQQGTGPDGAVPGYQLSGKTGTAQKIDPATQAYSNSDYWITFAGIAPSDDPRFVVGIMIDDPKRGTDGQAGSSAAPLFKDISSWLLDHYNIPLSPPDDSQFLLTTS